MLCRRSVGDLLGEWGERGLPVHLVLEMCSVLITKMIRMIGISGILG